MRRRQKERRRDHACFCGGRRAEWLVLRDQGGVQTGRWPVCADHLALSSWPVEMKLRVGIAVADYGDVFWEDRAGTRLFAALGPVGGWQD